MKKATSIYLYFLTGFFPLVFSPDGFSNIFATKRFFFVTSTLIYLASIIVLCIVKRYRPRLNIPCYFAIGYLVTTVISALVSEHFPKTLLGTSRFEGLFTVFLYVAVFICVSLFGNISSGIQYTLIGSSFIFGVICVLQLQGLNPFGLYPSNMTFFDGGVRYSGSYIGTIGNADLVGAYLCIVIPLLFFILIRSRIKLKALALFPLATLIYTAMKMSVSACIVGLAAGLVFAVPIILHLKKKGVLIYSTALVTTAVAGLIVLYKVDFDAGLFHELHEILNGNISDEFGSNRIRIWRDVISVIPEAVLFGKGPDTMLLEGFEKFSTYYPALNKALTTSIDVAHNEYLNVLYHQGALGLISYLGIILSSLFIWLKNNRSALGISVIAYCTSAFFGFSMCLVAPFFWTALALMTKASDDSEAFI
ncbi:MAG: O-antigen ligase family protein [Clostridia bacterium]|nr:O-antigen ligase family protein [Clostridia bacterium]